MANNASACHESALMKMPSLLITRPKASAERFVARLSEDTRARFKIVISPLMEITSTDAQPNLTGYAGVIFTSANAVGFAPLGGERQVYCVGELTTKRAQAAGWKVMITAGNADALVAAMENVTTTGPLIHLAGRYRRGEIAERLKAQGKHVEVQTLYDQQLLPLSDIAQAMLEGEGSVVVPLFSPRTATHFIHEAASMNNVTVVAMSDAVAAACNVILGPKMVIAAAPNGDEMLRGVEKALCDNSFA